MSLSHKLAKQKPKNSTVLISIDNMKTPDSQKPSATTARTDQRSTPKLYLDL